MGTRLSHCPPWRPWALSPHRGMSICTCGRQRLEPDLGGGIGQPHPAAETCALNPSDLHALLQRGNSQAASACARRTQGDHPCGVQDRAQHMVRLPLWLQPGHRNSQLPGCVHRPSGEGMHSQPLPWVIYGPALTSLGFSLQCQM